MTRGESSFVALFPNPHERALLSGLLTSPDDPALGLVYADWLEEHGDAVGLLRAEFLRLRAARAERKGYVAEERLTALRGQVGPRWLAVIGDVGEGFRDLQDRIARKWTKGGWRDFLKITSDHGLLHFHYSGALDDELCDELCQRLVEPRVAAVLHSLRFDPCPERGFANGTLTFGLDWLSAAEPAFPQLASVTLTPLSGFVIHDYQESGALGRLLRKCRALEHLMTPSAPDATFFEGGPFALESLSVTAGYAHERFLLNLSRSTCFPDLRALAFADYRERYGEDWREQTTPFEHYEALFRSPLMKQLERVVLREALLDEGQTHELLRVRSSGVTIERCQEG